MTDDQAQTRRAMVQMLHTLPHSPPHPCAYLPGQVARDRGFAVHHMEPESWQNMLEAGWRRSGMTIYQPACPFCTQCRSLRIPVGEFKPDRTMRRLRRAAADLHMRLGPMALDQEHYELYHRYITHRHNGLMSGSRREFELFLGQSPVDTCQIEMRLDGRLICVGTIDRMPAAWSCVYCYYDPLLPRRSLGTLNILTAIQWCRERCPAAEKAHLYLGYWVEGSTTMAYKARFRPHDVLLGAGRWLRAGRRVGESTDGFGPRPNSYEGSVSIGSSSP